MKCVLCKKEEVIEKGLCQYHNKAQINLKNGFIKWKDGYGEMSWRTYLIENSRLSETGKYVKEVIEYNLKEDVGEK